MVFTVFRFGELSRSKKKCLISVQLYISEFSVRSIVVNKYPFVFRGQLMPASNYGIFSLSLVYPLMTLGFVVLFANVVNCFFDILPILILSFIILPSEKSNLLHLSHDKILLSLISFWRQ